MELKLGNPALLSMEMQRGVVGDLAQAAMIGDAARQAGIVSRLAGLMDACRSATVPVIHCNAVFRPDLKGTSRNTPIIAALTRNGVAHLAEGTPGAKLVAGLCVVEGDFVMNRIHGMTPFMGTSLDQILRNMGIDTVIACGVSLNIGVLGLCLSAIDLGYRVILARDCTVGYPIEYGEAVIANTLSLIAKVSDSATIADALAARS